MSLRSSSFAALALVLLTGILPDSGRAASVLPQPVRRTIGNGLDVVVFPSNRLPLVHIQLRVPAGLAAEPAGQEGVAWVTAEMLRHGTSTRDATEFANEVDRTGASLVPSVGRDFATFGGTFLARDFEKALELASDAVVEPVFAATELALVQTQTLRQLSSRTSADEDALREAMFGDHPYGRPILGRAPAIAKLDQAQVRSFWSSSWRPDHAVLVIAGDVTPERTFAAVEEWFGRWTGSASVPRTAAPPAAGPAKVRIIDVPTTRAELRIGLAGPARGAADEPSLFVASTLYGGVPSKRPAGERSRFGREVRSSFAPAGTGGLFTVALSAPIDSAGAAARDLIGMLRDLNAPPAEADLAEAKRLLARELPMQLETLASWATAWNGADFATSDAAAYFDRYDERVDALTPAGVAGAAAKWLDPERATIVAIGPASRLEPQLRAFGAVTVVRPGERAATDSTAAAAPPKPAVTGTTAQKTRGRDLIKRATVAHGGLTKLKGVRDSRMEARVTVDIGTQKLEGNLSQARSEPDRMVSITDVGGIAIRQTLVGDRAWQMTQADTASRDMDADGIAALRNGFYTDVVHLLLLANDAKAVVFSKGQATIGTVRADAVVVRAPKQVERTYYIHPTTRRLIAFDQGEERVGAGVVARRTFSDFRAVGGIQWPHHEERLLNGESVMKVDVVSLRLNTGIPETAFSRR